MKSRININALIDEFYQQPFVVGSSTYTYISFFKRVQKIAENLTTLGIKKGDVVIINMKKPEDIVFLLFAIIHIKAIAFPLNPKVTSERLSKLKKFSKASCIISNRVDVDNTITQGEIFNGTKEEISLRKPDWDYNIPALIILTSGSSGEPKMVVHSLHSLLFSAKTINTYFDIRKQDRLLLSLPLYHIAGLAIVFRCLISGAALLIPKEKTDITSIEALKPSRISLVSTQLWRSLNNTLSLEILKNCKTVFLGGSAIQQSLIQKSLEKGLHIYTSYGLTEMASTVAIKKITNYSTDAAEILPFYTIKISEEDEILLKGEALCMGYLENGKIKKNVNKEGWYNTGDLGFLKDKLITVFGRKDNMFISGGENIYPEEIEKHLLLIDGIQKAVVIAVEDDEFGQRPLAFIKTYAEMDITRIIMYLKKDLPSYKIPDRFLPWPKDYIEHDAKVNRQYFKTLL